MPTLTLIGSAFWIVAILFGGTISKDGVSYGKNKFERFVIRVIAMPILLTMAGLFLGLLGLVGVILLSPILHLFGATIFSYKF